MKLKMKLLIALVVLGIATLLFAQQQYRRQPMICPIDGAQMNWTGNQQGTGNYASCEFSHMAYEADPNSLAGRQVKHTAWASCTE